MTALLPLAVVAHASFFQLPMSNGFGASIYDLQQRKITALHEHVYRAFDQGIPTRSVLYDAYFGMRVAGQSAWLNSLPVEGASLAAGVAHTVQQFGGLVARQSFFAPWGLLAPGLVMVLEVKNKGVQPLDDVHLFSLHNPHLGNGDGTVGQRADWDGTHQSFLHRGTTTGRLLLVRSLGPTARHAVHPNNPYLAVSSGQLLTSTDSSGDANDIASGFQYDLGTLAPGATVTVGVLLVYQPAGSSASLMALTEGYIAGREAAALRLAEETGWQDWLAAAKLPGGLSESETALYRQQLAILRMAQSREPNRIQDDALPSGQLVASLPPGQWNIAWVRDACLAIAALARAGYAMEARAGLEFMLRSRAGLYSSYVGRPYRISVVRYFGRGKEESDSDAGGPNIEFDGFGLLLWAADEYLKASGDGEFLSRWWPTLSEGVGDVLVALREPNGLLAADSSIWESHWQGRQHYTWTSTWAAVGLIRAAGWAEARDGLRAVRYRTTAFGLAAAIAAQWVDGVLRPSTESPSRLDAAVLETFNQSVISPFTPIAANTLRAIQERLATATGHGYKRNENGDAYDEREWVLIDLRLSLALERQGKKEEAAALWGWVRDQALVNHGLIPELYDPSSGDYAGAVPMVGFGAGAYVLTAWDRAVLVSTADVQKTAPPGCSVGGRPATFSWLIVVALILLRRRAAAFLLLLGCSAEPPREPPAIRSCVTEFQFVPGQAVESLGVAGEWNSFDPSALPMAGPDRGGHYRALAKIPVGAHGYKFVLRQGGQQKWILDPGNPYRKFIDGTENSLVEVSDCHVPLVELASFHKTPAGAITAVANYLDDGTGPNPAALTAELDGKALEVLVEGARLRVSALGLATGKHRLNLRASDRKGRTANDLELPFWIEPQPFDWRDGIQYFVFTDRFRDGDATNNAPLGDVAARANYGGGDFAGIQAALEEGYFDALGVRTLWISPPNRGPSHAELGSDGRLYSNYHGYWPTAGRTVEPRFGDLAGLRTLVTAAHQRGIRVIVDLVLNHVHVEHPYYLDHRFDGWFNGDGSCLCGSLNCDWESHRLDCWFAPYLPDVRYESFPALLAMVDDALEWVRVGDVDGFRVDAVKHFPHAVSRRLRARLRARFEHVEPLHYLIGETFTGGGQSDRAFVQSFLGPDELHAQFDFPLYWHLLGAFAAESESLVDLDQAVLASEAAYSGAPMAPFLGNHDLPRFLSTAAGMISQDPKAQAWEAPPPAPESELPYQKLRLALAFLFTQPGVPLLYYGDEYGEPGAGDPDNRRMMKWVGHSPFEQATLEWTRKLGSLRGSLPALQRGQRYTLHVEKDLYVYARVIDGKMAIVGINRGGAGKTLQVGLRPEVALADGTELTDRLGGVAAVVSGAKLSLTLPPRGAAIWTP